MSLAKKKNKKYTCRDYLKWPDDERWEIINGEAYDMSPSPIRRHQELSLNLAFELKRDLDTRRYPDCRVYEAPMDVIFDEYNVVQPDIFMVCDKDRDTDYIFEVPKLTMEIISKSTAYKDTKIKKDLYERFKVEEYIIVFPELEIVERYLLEDNKYLTPERFNWDEVLKLKTFDIELNLWEIFETELPEEEKN